MSKKIFIGTDSGATTTKFSAVWENGEAISTKLLQRPTSSEKGRAAVISGWISGIGEFLAQNNLQWSQVHGVGLAIPGPYERYGVFGKTPNLPASFSGWDVYSDYSAALAKQAGRAVPLVVGNDGNYGAAARHSSARTAWRGKATRWPGWKPATCPPRSTCSAPPANRSRAAAVATGAVWKLTRLFPARSEEHTAELP